MHVSLPAVLGCFVADNNACSVLSRIIACPVLIFCLVPIEFPRLIAGPKNDRAQRRRYPIHELCFGNGASIAEHAPLNSASL